MTFVGKDFVWVASAYALASTALLPASGGMAEVGPLCTIYCYSAHFWTGLRASSDNAQFASLVRAWKRPMRGGEEHELADRRAE